MPYQQGVVSCGTTATLIATPGVVPDNEAILIQNLGTTTVYIGGSTETAGTTATGGLQVAANAIVSVPCTGAASERIYGVSTAACNVAYLFPG